MVRFQYEYQQLLPQTTGGYRHNATLYIAAVEMVSRQLHTFLLPLGQPLAWSRHDQVEDTIVELGTPKARSFGTRNAVGATSKVAALAEGA